MKTRTGFVSNSSSSSFIVVNKNVVTMRLKDIPPPSLSFRNLAIRITKNNSYMILKLCEELGWLWYDGSKPTSIPSTAPTDLPEWWLYLGDFNQCCLLHSSLLIDGYIGYDILDQDVSKPISSDICKQCGGTGTVIGMACICDSCGNIIWGC